MMYLRYCYFRKKKGNTELCIRFSTILMISHNGYPIETPVCTITYRIQGDNEKQVKVRAEIINKTINYWRMAEKF